MAHQVEHGLHAPGLKRMKRHNGRVDLYWVADEALVQKGYQPKTVRIHTLDWNLEADRIEIAACCQRFDANMRAWAKHTGQCTDVATSGTIAWVAKAFETDEESPYHDKRRDTQIFYSRYIKMIAKAAGSRRIGQVTGIDLRRWHKHWVAAHGERSAYACIQTFRRVVGYGCELADDHCLKLAQILERMEFKSPRARKRRPTYTQIVAFREAAHTAGRQSLALAITLQFDLGLRQKDVIGEWVPSQSDPHRVHSAAITDGAWRWDWGLTWDHISNEMILKKPTSKSNGFETAEHDLTLYPDLIDELARILMQQRTGPLVRDERSGQPWRKSHFSRTFRKIARQAGWPDDIWNMDSRAGAVSEAFEAGAQAEDVMKVASHSQLSTTMRYNRGKIVQARRVAQLRIARRNSLGAEPGRGSP